MIFKICGLKNEDSLMCCENNNVDFFGMIFYKKSPRNINLYEAKNLTNLSKGLKINPVGVFLSNGPGDPKATYNKIKNNLKSLFNLSIPTFGICLGHQILALFFEAKTKKMHHGHRGANHPVKNLKKDSVEITVQNHGFVVEKEGLPKDITITHVSLFDGTISGIEIKNKPFFSVQYHPEASPGPHDSQYLFLKFKEYIETYAKKK